MEVKFQYEDNIKLLTLDKVNIILGSNCSGKTNILDHLNSSLTGGDPHAQLNGLPIQRGMIDVVYIKYDRNLENEIELKTGSIVKSNVIKEFAQENKEILFDNFTKYLNDFMITFKKDYTTNFNFYLSTSKIEFDEEKINKLNLSLFEILFDRKLSSSIMEEYYIRQKINLSTTDFTQVVLIDDIDRYLDFQTINYLLNSYTNNTTFVLTTKNKYLLNEVNFDNIYDSTLSRINLLEIAKVEFYKDHISREDVNMNLDDFILENEELYYEEDFLLFLSKNLLNIINSLEI